MPPFAVPAELARRYDVCFKSIAIGKWVNLDMLAVRDPDVLIDEIDPECYDEDERLPYWAEIWPSAIGLGRHLFEYPAPAGSRILELGCGIGLAGIAAAAAGLAVTACDYEEDALVFARYNARLNALDGRVSVRFLDWRNPDLDHKYTIVIGSDILYERPNHDPIQRLLHETLEPGGMFLASDPDRRAAAPFVESMIARGYRHSAQPRKVKFESKDNRIIVHRFLKED